MNSGDNNDDGGNNKLMQVIKNKNKLTVTFYV